MQVIDDTIDFDAYLQVPDESASIRPASDWLDAVLDAFERPPQQTGATLPWLNTHNIVRLRRGELSIWPGMSGHGKSMLIGQVALGLMAQGEKVCIASMEMKPGSTMQRMCRQAFGCNTPARRDIQDIHPYFQIKQQFPDAGIVALSANFVLYGERTIRELQGQQCIELEDAPAAKKQIACTRSFGGAVTELEGLRQAVSEFASRAAEKLRAQGSVTGEIVVFIQTSPFRVQDAQHARSLAVILRRPSSNTLDIVQAAVRGVETIYREGFRYAKAGVMLMDLAPEGVQQGELDLFDNAEPVQPTNSGRLMGALDAINAKFGKGSVRVAAAVRGPEAVWQMRQDLRTPHYTTTWEDLPVVLAD